MVHHADAPVKPPIPAIVQRNRLLLRQRLDRLRGHQLDRPVQQHAGHHRRRGPITGYSRRSQRRLRAKLNAMPLAHAQTKTVTLTFGANAPTFENSYVYLKRFLRVFKKRFPQAWGNWIREAQRRNVAHYHLVVNGVEHRIPPDDVATMWRAVIFDTLNEAEKRHSTHLVRVQKTANAKSEKNALDYLAKRRSKPENATGKTWGKFGHFGSDMTPPCNS